MSKIGDISNKKIGEQLTRLCHLSGISHPDTDEAVQGIVYNFKSNWKAHSLDTLRKAIDYFLSGQSQVKPLRQYNAIFLNQIMREYVSIHSSKAEVQKHQQAEIKLTDKDWIASYRLLMHQYCESFEGGKFTFMPKVAEAICNWVQNVKGGFQQYKPNQIQIDQAKRDLEDYMRRWEAWTQQQEKIVVSQAIINSITARTMSSIDADKVAMVIAHFRIKIKNNG